MESKLDITVLITSINQRGVTIKTANYYSKICSEVIIVDEELPKMSTTNISIMSKRGITYIPYVRKGYKNEYYEKRSVCADQSNSEYLVHSNHDERYTYTGLKACLSELKKNKSLSFCAGQAIAIRKGQSGLFYTFSYDNLNGYRNIMDINERLYYHAEKYVPIAHYAVWRKENYIDTIEKTVNIHKSIDSYTMLEELVFEFAADLSGDSMALNELFWIRNRCNPPAGFSTGDVQSKGNQSFLAIESKLRVLFDILDDIQINIIMGAVRKKFYFARSGYNPKVNIIISLIKIDRKMWNSLFNRWYTFILLRFNLNKIKKVNCKNTVDDFLSEKDIAYNKNDVVNAIKSMTCKDNSPTEEESIKVLTVN